jgi:class 3 adenylate cyclase
MAAIRNGVSRLSGEFLDGEVEADYRSTQRQAESDQIRLIWMWALLFFCVYGAIDVLFLSRGFDLFTLRLAILGCGGLAIVLGATVGSYKTRDQINFLALLLVSMCYVQLLQQRDMPGNSQGAILLLVVGMYMFSPGRFYWVCVNGIGCSLLFWYSVGSEVGRLGGWVSHSYLIPANLLAALALARLNRARRHAYANQQKLRLAHRQSRRLLYNTLPRETVLFLQKYPGQLPARQIDAASVVFADIVGFTDLSRQLSAARLVALLNSLFSSFDLALEQLGLEKIKTLGDAYMAVAGAPAKMPNHVEIAVAFAVAQLRCCREVGASVGLPLRLRVGVNSGPLVAGVIGRKRYAFDVWGETVNVASRLQAAAAPGQILVSAAVRNVCGEQFHFSPPRQVALKGCGNVEVYYLDSSRCCSSQSDIASAVASTDDCAAGGTV